MVVAIETRIVVGTDSIVDDHHVVVDADIVEVAIEVVEVKHSSVQVE